MDSVAEVVLVRCSVAVEADVRAALDADVRVQVFGADTLVDARHELSAYGHGIVGEAAGSTAVLVEWDFDQAPAINTLCYHLRRQPATPAIGLVDHPASLTACLATGADYAFVGAPSWPFVQATALAYHRLVGAAQRAAAPVSEGKGTEQRFGPLRLDTRAHRFYIGDSEVVLTPREFALVRYLIVHARELRTRQQILDEVWGITFDTGTNMVDVYMFFLRRKLEAHGLKGMIETVRGQGYRLVEATAA